MTHVSSTTTEHTMTTTDTCTDTPSNKAATIARSATASVMLADLPPVGQPLNGGTFVGLTTTREGTHCAVVLLDDKPKKRLAWDNATAWAASLDAQLPSRPVAALLYANCKPLLAPTWHWPSDELHPDTGDAEDASCAWGCVFDNGNHYCGHKSAEGAAVAVRLIPLSA